MQYSFTGTTAMKKLAQLNDELTLIYQKEATDCKYTYIAGEVPVIPEYDFMEVRGKVGRIHKNIVAMKSAIRKFNAEHKGTVTGMTVDEMLVYLPMYTREKNYIRSMLVMPTKTRNTRANVSEYTQLNFEPKIAQTAYEYVCSQIVAIQNDLNEINVGYPFTVDLIDD